MDYFKILGVSKNATDKEIKIAYRKLAKKYHPDTYKGDKTFAENKMKEINEAYDVLSDETKRRALLQEEQYENTYTKYQNTTTSSTEQTNNYSSSNYERGSVYDFDKHYNRHYNQSYSQYNYNPYYDENDSANMYYIDFTQLKNKFLKGVKHAFLIFVIVVIILIAFIIAGIKMLFSGINNFFDSLTNTNSTTVTEQQLPNSNTTTPNTTLPETNQYTPDYFYNEEEYQAKLKELNEALEKYAAENKEAIDKEVEELNKAYDEWYNTQGKAYEAELEELLKEIEKELQKN